MFLGPHIFAKSYRENTFLDHMSGLVSRADHKTYKYAAWARDSGARFAPFVLAPSVVFTVKPPTSSRLSQMNVHASHPLPPASVCNLLSLSLALSGSEVLGK